MDASTVVAIPEKVGHGSSCSRFGGMGDGGERKQKRWSVLDGDTNGSEKRRTEKEDRFRGFVVRVYAGCGNTNKG